MSLRLPIRLIQNPEKKKLLTLLGILFHTDIKNDYCGVNDIKALFRSLFRSFFSLLSFFRSLLSDGHPYA
jgi:hypothetical protein